MAYLKEDAAITTRWLNSDVYAEELAEAFLESAVLGDDPADHEARWSSFLEPEEAAVSAVADTALLLPLTVDGLPFLDDSFESEY